MTQPPIQPPAAPGQPYQQGGPVSPGQPYPPQQYGPPVSPPPYAPQYGPPGWTPPPPQKSFWGTAKGQLAIAGITVGGVVLLGGLMVLGALSERSSTSKMDVDITSCSFSGSATLPSATVGYTVKNTGKSTRSVSIKIEYRDSSGARLDTDTAYVRDVAAGDTVRGEETTILDAAPSGSTGRCLIVGVS